MEYDLEPVFDKYRALRDETDKIFAAMTREYPDNVHCHPGCDDCCRALFDLSLVEAMYINHAFEKAFPHGPQRSAILERASTLDRELTRLKRKMYRAEKDGESMEHIMAEAAAARSPCALLSGGQCLLYEERPITCRLYGIPCAINGKAYVCGLSHFSKGEKFPTVRLDKIQERLEAMSAEIATLVQSRFELAEVYVPLSMALLTRYDDAYLGIGEAGKDE